MKIDKTIAEIESCFSHPELFAFWNLCEDFVKRENTPVFSYLGLNFNNETVVSIKFYVHFFRDLSVEEIDKFLPKNEDYLKFIHLKTRTHPSDFHPTNSGIALELKFVNGQNSPRKGFFYHLKNCNESYDALGITRDLINPPDALGINYEYELDKTIFKNYFYYSQKESISSLSKKFGDKLIDDAHIVEFAESNNISKLNLIFVEKEFPRIREKISDFLESEWEVIRILNEKYGFFNTAFGYYFKPSTVKSMYFFKTPYESDNALYSNVLSEIIKQNSQD
jgi:hypothetical protein